MRGHRAATWPCLRETIRYAAVSTEYFAQSALMRLHPPQQSVTSGGRALRLMRAALRDDCCSSSLSESLLGADLLDLPNCDFRNGRLMEALTGTGNLGNRFPHITTAALVGKSYPWDEWAAHPSKGSRSKESDK